MPADRSSKRTLLRNRKSKTEEAVPAEKEPLLKTFIVPITLAMIALLGSVFSNFYNNINETNLAERKYKSDRELAETKYQSDRELAEKKYRSDLVLKALESKSPDEKLFTLRMLADLNLIKEPEVLDGINRYIVSKIKNPEGTAQTKSSSGQTSELPPLRIYLLSEKSKSAGFDEVKEVLASNGYTVLASEITTKVIYDDTRPNTPEIRYFNTVDKERAEAIATSLKVKVLDISVIKIIDERAKPGYIEIWLGR